MKYTSDKIIVWSMLRAIRKISEYAKMNAPQSIVDDANLYLISNLGEAANKLSSELKNKNPHIPWKEMISMRNVVIHDYMGIDLDIVHQTIIFDIIPLQEKLECILDNLTKDEKNG